MKVARVRKGPVPRLTSPYGIGGTTPQPALDDISDVDLTGLVDGDTIVFDDATDTWVPGTGGGGGGDVWWLNVEDYGAVHDGVTDDTSAIQDAIDAAGANAASGSGPAAVWFPDGVYIVAGALQDTGRSNAQLLLPRINTTSAEQIAIYLFGNTPARPMVSVGATTLATPDNGVILKSTLSSGTGALLGAWGPSGSWQDGSAVQVKIENMAFRMVANPTNSCLDFSHVMGVELINVMVDTGEYNIPSVTQPTHTGSYGVRSPSNVTSSGFAWFRTVNVVGFWCGFQLQELSNSDMVNAWACIYGFDFTAANHSITVKRLGSYGVQRGITSSTGTSTVYVDILDFDTEHDPAPAWAVAVYDIDDPNNSMRGYVRFHRQDYGGSPGVAPLVNGGNGLEISVGWFGYTRMPNVLSAPASPPDGGWFYGSGDLPMWKDQGGTVYDLTDTHPTGSAGGDLSGTYPNPAVVDDSHNHTAATISGISGGHILLADGHATPFTFDDMLQMDDGSDFMWSDPE